MYVSAIIPAAGLGKRFCVATPKPLIKLESKPIIIYSLEKLSKHALIKEIIVVTNALNRRGILAGIKRYRIKKVKALVSGGKKRQDSVYNGLKAVSARADLVLIHDAARPFINKKIISSVINGAGKTGAAIAAVPVKATIKEAASKYIVGKTLDRSRLWEVQTPQVFRKEVIQKAYKKFSKIPVTDDAMLVEKLGRKVSLVMGSYNNLKITTPEDLGVARYVLQSRHRL